MLPRDGAAAEAIYAALRAGYLRLPARPDLATKKGRSTAEQFDARAIRIVEEQTAAWFGVRSFDHLTPSQVKCFAAASIIKLDADLDSDAFRAIDAATGAQ
jgi:hypothetical protein